MSRLGQICPVLGPDMSDHQKLRTVEKYIGSQEDASRSQKLTISKVDNMELREITETTRSNLNSRIQSYGWVKP
jgi:hypothetical protein